MILSRPWRHEADVCGAPCHEGGGAKNFWLLREASRRLLLPRRMLDPCAGLKLQRRSASQKLAGGAIPHGIPEAPA
eukprot:CAMPEP_0183456182 /NCGR_PEP_ID=MMETSP0370-20130417/128368_1 /TAXON_ID=268820 /ORGANISM="Peridinium aciculiferum, Strain PAER-2" /LENGTH=75 /DNA_ID=CAMNT_0025647805 /DNA_START=14 /DNA_END=237 /DNA_ORIENTATION=+